MAANNAHVLKIPRSDDKGTFVLVRVCPSSPSGPPGPSGPHPLHVKLVATEGVAPYAFSLRQDRLDRLRVKNAPCSADDWERILTRILLDQGHQDHQDHQEPVDGVDATATVEEEQRLIITVRRRVQNITQRLGTLTLPYDENEDIELFDWCAEAVDACSQAQARLTQAAADRDKLDRAVDDLRQQLEEFLAAKEDDEKAMLAKFCQLLNEKKVKIRVQQQQLAAYTKTAAAEPKEEEEDAVRIKEEDSSLPLPMPPPARRGAKRRAEAALAEDNGPGADSDSDDGFEGPATRTRTGTAASTRSATAGPAVAEEPASSGAEQTTDHDESTDSDAMDEGESKGREKEVPKAAEKVEAPPPRRNLAFALPRKTPPAAAPAAAHAQDSETDSDDEL